MDDQAQTQPLGSRRRDNLRRNWQAIMETMELARQLGNVSLACRRMSVSRATFYRKTKAQQVSESGIVEPPRKPRMPNTFTEATVQLILALTKRYPNYSYPRIANQLKQQGVKASPSGVQKLWKRLGITKKAARIRFASAATEAAQTE